MPLDAIKWDNIDEVTDDLADKIELYLQDCLCIPITSDIKHNLRELINTTLTNNIKTIEEDELLEFAGRY